MDWFERLTGISPDGGNGWYELLIYAAVVAAVCLFVWRSRFARRAERSRLP